MLTPADVEQKTFSTALRGYDLDEVDDFLDEVVATIRELTEQLEEARSAAVGAPSAVTLEATEAPVAEETPPEPPPADTPRVDIDESAIGRALVAAQTAADRLLEEAEAQASRIVEDAQSEADSWTAEREAKRHEAQAEIAALAARVASVRSELAVLAGEVSEKLDDMDAAIESSEMEDGETEEPTDETTLSGIPDDDHDSENDDEPGGYDDDVDVPESGNASDHLDEILTGVATDLQLGSSEDDEESDEDGGLDEPDEDE